MRRRRVFAICYFCVITILEIVKFNILVLS